MNNARKVTASLIVALLVFAIWTTAGLSQDQGSRQPAPPARQDLSTRTAAQSRLRQIGAEEKLVRDVYARLMRYQSAARDELASRDGKSSEPNDYLTFELRDIHSGSIETIADRSLSEMVTTRNGAVITITPNHLSNGAEPSHAYYTAEWTKIAAEKQTADSTVGAMLRARGADAANINRYTSFEVTIRLQGEKRTYRALAVYQFENPSEKGLAAEQQQSVRPTGIEIWDNVTPEMNTVLKDESPAVHAPWNKYVQSGWYRTVVNEIRETRATNKPLIPATAPIGYLPGDNIAENNARINDPCPVITVTLTATGVQESSQATHFISLKNTGNVTITATLDPATTDPASITWTGGTAGADNLHRIVVSTTVADTDVTAAVTGSSAIVRIHVIDATAPPANTSATKTSSLAGAANPGSDFGLTVVTIGTQGVTRPTYHVDPYFDGNHWVFRLRDVTHEYKLGTNSQGRTNLPTGNPTPFPLATGMNLTQSHTEARDDLDTSGLTNTGPRRRSYWVDFITQNHEQAHVNRFYSAAFWLAHMALFESDDVEKSTVTVVYDCADATTTTGAAAVTKKTAGWDTAITTRHGDADSAEITGSEAAAHGVSNPQYAAIRNAIPNP